MEITIDRILTQSEFNELVLAVGNLKHTSRKNFMGELEFTILEDITATKENSFELMKFISENGLTFRNGLRGNKLA